MAIIAAMQCSLLARSCRRFAPWALWLVAASVAAGAESVPVKVEQAWVRPAVPGQQGTGGYMKLTAVEAQRLVRVSSPVAGVAEIHQMKMEGDVMKMSPAGVLELPAGRTVELKPGGLHLMLMDLKRPLPAGSTVALTLVLRNRAGIESRVDTVLRVSATAPPAGTAASARRH
jgi:copper(I)-binding protein